MIDIKIPDISTLRRIKAISRLSETQLIALANQLRVLTAKRNEFLLRHGSTEISSLYIIEGKIRQSALDGKTTEIEVKVTDDMKPIAQLRPSIYDIQALGNVSYLKIDRQKLVDFTQLSGLETVDISVHSLFTDSDEEDNSVVNHLYRNLMDNSIRLPALPSVAERVQKIYQGRTTDLKGLVNILVAYPDLAMKIKNIARCPVDNKWSSSEKIRYSVKRLGIRSVYSIVMIYAIGKLVSRMPEVHLQRVASFWQHSLNVAAISRILAKTSQSFPPDLAMLAGLIHGIGVLVIDDRLLEHHHLMLNHLEIDHAIQAMRPEISSLLLRKWQFDDDLILVAEECGDWSRDNQLTADLCDLVLVANYLAMMQSDRNHTLPPIGSIPAMAKLAITPAESINAIKESAVVRRNIKKLFS